MYDKYLDEVPVGEWPRLSYFFTPPSPPYGQPLPPAAPAERRTPLHVGQDIANMFRQSRAQNNQQTAAGADEDVNGAADKEGENEGADIDEGSAGRKVELKQVREAERMLRSMVCEDTQASATHIHRRPERDPMGYYALLGVSQDATLDEIKKARDNILLHGGHLDKAVAATNKANSTRLAQTVNEAFETLGNPEKRRVYDLPYGIEVIRPEPPPEVRDFATWRARQEWERKERERDGLPPKTFEGLLGFMEPHFSGLVPRCATSTPPSHTRTTSPSRPQPTQPATPTATGQEIPPLLSSVCGGGRRGRLVYDNAFTGEAEYWRQQEDGVWVVHSGQEGPFWRMAACMACCRVACLEEGRCVIDKTKQTIDCVVDCVRGLVEEG
ncbi:unnamed protein product [Vitrella brassicaformis CCMP3155]|uniref:J domain-containing protein n=1 Tax=Vitrella brassicaformis (strain CCMP3155) TaxID=1169540 RepID=A0A0G4EBV6_VITBC|nr:unnamed protein product [Vitrella brassicaformis CCMP3155]|eukprot:CEL93461.1 unnamed protein product [Vitrella brassicaformis CCMP3155]